MVSPAAAAAAAITPLDAGRLPRYAECVAAATTSAAVRR